MPLIGNEKNYNIFDLFKELSYLAQNSVYIKRIIKKQSEEEIIKIFNEIEEILIKRDFELFKVFFAF